MQAPSRPGLQAGGPSTVLRRAIAFAIPRLRRLRMTVAWGRMCAVYNLRMRKIVFVTALLLLASGLVVLLSVAP